MNVLDVLLSPTIMQAMVCPWSRLVEGKAESSADNYIS